MEIFEILCVWIENKKKKCIVMDQPLFSILIANYNNGHYLMEAVESVRQQTYSNWEIILVDDGSTDNSHELYKQLVEQDSRIHIFFNEENKGCGYTKRRCAELSNGEICGFLDPDDTLLPEALEKHIAMHIEKRGCSCVFSRYYLCDTKLNVRAESRRLILRPNESYLTHRDYRPETFCSFKISLYNQTEGISSDLKLAVDQDLYFKLEEIAPVCVMNEFTYKYRIHDNNISQDPSDKAFYWNLLVRHRACKRRGLDPSLYSEKDFVEFLINKYNEGADKVRKSLAYRIGKFMLKPFCWIKKV